ncbi:MAG: phage tail tape measure protein, partial [Eubacterium sp.]
MDFGKSMGMVSTLIDGTTEVAKARTKELSKSVLQVSTDTGVAAKDISGGLYQVISAYGDTADSTKILEIAAKGAKASGASTADTINLLSAVTKGYGDTSAGANQKAADLAFMTAKLGQTTFPELAGSIGQVVPLCENLKVSQEELFGVMATATGVTGNASEVTTQFKGVLQSLMSPTASMTKLFGELGYTNGQAMIESLGFQGSLNAIVKAAEDSGVPLQDYIGSIEGQVLALALAGAQSENLTEKTKAMTEATGAANEAYEKSQDNIGAKFEKALNKAMNAMIKLGDAAAPMLEEISTLIEEAADWFAKLTDEQQENIVKWGGVAMAAGPVLKLLGGGLETFAKL